MEFCKSQTYLNLAKSFAGEAQAGLRYQFIADLCTQQGYKIVADEIRGLAKNEVNHAKVFFNHIVENGGNRSNIEITAGYPFEGKTIEEGLKFGKERGRENLSRVSEGCAVRRLYGDREIVRLDRGSRNFTRGKVQVSVRELSERNAL